jgi:hypothetical protein
MMDFAKNLQFGKIPNFEPNAVRQPLVKVFEAVRGSQNHYYASRSSLNGTTSTTVQVACINDPPTLRDTL